ncbi:4Fe-4S dicluster domain-containing protein [Pseudodesulfovibrio sp. F-1]|uniref:4Fe-4S dicluster domain-containing protein n=1 Tax=Pseudodesulfovibrio alkaliphilus TaxID=2661613 RepID=A0A7K1KPQ6_9BACT|nr:LUD domain-containing protein [Pseudodesulfovibrio alkaliphilus]MUM78068.1 4Fe-4S dicluster domain-containing protein [Pseudodesulfovibrio alkaliphilus]
MQKANNLKEYRSELRESLDNDFLRTTLDNFAVAYRAGRANAFKDMDVHGLIDEIACSKDEAAASLDALYKQFKEKAEAAGVHVHLAKDAKEANDIIASIAKNANCKKIVKSKSMTAEETLLNHALEDEGLEVTETDLGEWIIQLRHEGPSHMVMPAIHLSRYQVGDLFTEVTGKKQDSEIEKLVKVARRELRQKYVEADMGISGANFAVAETGSIGLVTNEGNARLVTTLPRVHVALMGLDKLLPTLHDALRILKALPRNATGQAITSYVTWITGANECASAADGKKEIHFVLLDNGRSELAKDPLFSQVLRCVRCGACANVCPVYRLVGGHKMGHIYIGAIGLILTYFFHGKDAAKNLVQNCINCEACKDICAGGIDLPRLIKEIHARIQDEDGHPLPSLLLGKVLKNRKLFHTLLRTAKWAQKPVAEKDGFIRHLPMVFAKEHGFRALPTIAETPFRDRWEEIRPVVQNPRYRVALFSGCVQDFVYPEQMEAAVKLFAAESVDMSYPMGQSCCGLPVQMMGEMNASREVCVQNLRAFEAGGYDYVITLCASCAAHLKHNYPKLVMDTPSLALKAREFADRVIDYSSFVHDVLKVKADDFVQTGGKATYHAPCHLCRGLDVHEAPRELISTGGLEYVECGEEEVCCGFGGTFSMKFPELSAELLKKKLANVEATGAGVLLTDCPGCIMQLRGGLKNQGSSIKVRHVSEVLADNRKK